MILVVAAIVFVALLTLCPLSKNDKWRHVGVCGPDLFCLFWEFVFGILAAFEPFDFPINAFFAVNDRKITRVRRRRRRRRRRKKRR